MANLETTIKENFQHKNLKCRACKTCDGRACKGELPGMGGVQESAIFIENVKAWKRFFTELNITSNHQYESLKPARIRLAPMAGGVQNVGWYCEKDFYFAMLSASFYASLPLSIGDGFPDEKLHFALSSLQELRRKAAVFLKPYPQKNLLKRLDLAFPYADIIGVDIDAYNIITMRHQVSLEKKTPKELNELRRISQLPLAIKGVFSDEDIALVKESKPEIAIVSNHGGRIDRPLISSADFLSKHYAEISRYAGEVWVDGGIRCAKDLLSASALGAKEVLIGRPIISSLIAGGREGVKTFVDSLDAFPTS